MEDEENSRVEALEAERIPVGQLVDRLEVDSRTQTGGVVHIVAGLAEPSRPPTALRNLFGL